METTASGSVERPLMATYVITSGTHTHTVEIREDGTIRYDGENMPVDVKQVGDHQFSLLIEGYSTAIGVLKNGESYHVYHKGIQRIVTVESERARLLGGLAKPKGGRHTKLEITAPMPALVVRVEVQQGDHIREGQGLVVLEAMKMENEIRAHHGGIVKSVRVQAGKPVEKGEVLLLLEEE